MKKILVGILNFMLVISSVLVSATFIEKNYKNIENNNFENGIISSTFVIDDFKIEKRNQQDYIILENFGHYLIPGKPNLPSKIFTIAIPPGAELVDISYETGEEIVLPGNYDIIPCQLPYAIGEEDPIFRQKEEQRYWNNYYSVYTKDDSYPESNIEFVQTGGYRKYNIVDVRVLPFSYKPISGKLSYFPELTVYISYTYPEGFSEEQIMIDDIPELQKWEEKIIYNYNQAREWHPTSNERKETYDFVIITLDSLTSKIEPLVEWEDAKGKNVYVATTDWIASKYDGWDLAEKMRNFLRDKYPSEKWGILNVCLIGSYNDVPIRHTAQGADTDYYYAELSLPDSQSWDADGDHQYGENSDPIDFHTEVNVGRIPWSDKNIVEDICEKTAEYEQTNDPSFKKNILCIGTFFWPDTDNAVLMEMKTDPEENPWMEDWTKTTMYEEAQSSYPCDYDVSYANVMQVWSSGKYAFVNYAGHGSATACYEYYPQQPFVDTDTCNYLNDNYPAIVFACACSNSDTHYDNIGQMMMKQGAIGFLGATAVAYGFHGWNDPYDGASASLDYFFSTKCTSGDYTQGEAHQWALLEMYTYDLWYYQYLETFEWGALWGNPDLTMGVVSRPPETPVIPDGPSKWTINIETTFTTVTTDPEGDSISYLFDWGDGTDSGWVGPYGSGQIAEASHIWTKLGDFQVKAKAQDVYGVTSDWSETCTISIFENEPPNAAIITGPNSGSIKKLMTFTFVSTDPEGHDVYFAINWGDGFYVPYTGPYASGEEATFSHAWSEPNEYAISVKVKDGYGGKGPQSSYKINIKKNRAITNPVFFKFLENLIYRLTFLNMIFEKILWR